MGATILKHMIMVVLFSTINAFKSRQPYLLEIDLKIGALADRLFNASSFPMMVFLLHQ